MKVKLKGQRKIDYKTFLKTLGEIAKYKQWSKDQVKAQILSSQGKVLRGTKQ